MDFKKIKNLSPLEVRIIDESRKEFEQRGYFKASVDLIAERTGIGKATVYRHFGKKATLFLFTVMNIMYNWEKEYDRINEIEDFDTALEAYIMAGLRFNQKNGEFMKSISSEEGFLTIKNELQKNMDIKVMYAHIINSRQRLIDIIAHILDKGKAQKRIFPDIRTDLSAELIFMTFNQYFRASCEIADMKNMLGQKTEFSKEEGLTELKKLILRGLGVEKIVGDN
ncbi:MAG: TetR/AcrR family transcriptional regulator [Brevinematales bacterium]|nr:TetR/AcrR family transcriptional regulator [Brevinematales bacterium]